MWSTCSIDTGHSRTQAPQVTQSHTTSSVTAPGTSGVASPPARTAGPSSSSRSRRPMTRSFGDSAFPVAQAGHTSWQRPHSVQESVSSICFQVMSTSVPDPSRRASSSSTSKSSGSRRPRRLVRPNHTLSPAVAMCRCFEYGRYTRNRRIVRTCAHTKMRSRVSSHPPSLISVEMAFETGDQPAGHSLIPRAICEACQSRSVVTISAMRPRMKSASPRWLPSNRGGRCTLRIRNADATPTSTSTQKTSTRRKNHPWWPSQGSVQSASTAPRSAITIVGKSTTKPQKMKAWTRPGPRRWRSFRWPRTSVASCRNRRPTSPERSTPWPRRTIRYRRRARRANRPTATPRTTRSAHAEAAVLTAPGVRRRSDTLRSSQRCRDPLMVSD
jgi:hypothetical protein